jgi:LuxR family transcriptional regulator, maltose regulon positive regulatory protein
LAARPASARVHDGTSGMPRLPRIYLPRRQLWERLDDATEGAVTLLVAPVGAGKTLGVCGWLRDASSKHRRSARWIHVDADWTVERLADALDKAGASADKPGTGGADLVVLDNAQDLPLSCLRMIDHRLSTDPEHLRLLMLSRWDLPLTRLVPELLGQLTVLRGDLLRLGDDEGAVLVAAHARTDSPEVADAILRRTQGWCAAVVLAARAAGSSPDPVAVARRLAEGRLSVTDDVAGEVFASLTSRQRHILLCLAGERTVPASLAAHLSGDVEAGAVLDELESTGLLVARIGAATGTDDDIDPTYRLHPLMREVLRRRVAAGGVDVMRSRASLVRAVRLDIANGRSAGAFARLVAAYADDAAAHVLAVDGVRMVLSEGQQARVAEFARAHPDILEERPETWFVVALERWASDDLTRARHWMDRITERGLPERASDQVAIEVATVRLWRARMGIEPLDAALTHAGQVLDDVRTHDVTDPPTGAALALLANEMGIAHNWLGDLQQAEDLMTLALALSRAHGLVALVAASLTHLALTQFMAGREATCVDVAHEALVLLASPETGAAQTAPERARLALLLGGLVDLPWPSGLGEVPPPASHYQVHSADLTAKFWLRMRDARLALVAGSVPEAERILSTPFDSQLFSEAKLPHRLHVALLVERAFLAALATDRHALADLERRLADLGAVGEAELAGALLADLAGDRQRAADAFAAAAEHATYEQPPTRALAMTCHAQLLDTLGRPNAALDRMLEAAVITEVRRNAVPFLGWSRQGTPMETLLGRLAQGTPSPWVEELHRAAKGRPDLAAMYASSTPTPRELELAGEPVVQPHLSPREREVLSELARGATYADIAASLFLSENTVKTHVSSLYGKLAATRRSEALAVARRLHLL